MNFNSYKQLESEAPITI